MLVFFSGMRRSLVILQLFSKQTPSHREHRPALAAQWDITYILVSIACSPLQCLFFEPA